MRLVLDQIITTKLSLAVLLFDDFTQRESVFGEVKITIPDLNLEAIENPSGYYNFLDLENGTHTLMIQTEYYINEIVENVTLPKTVDYYFPVGGGALAGSTEAVLSDVTGLWDRDILEFNNGSDPPERRRITLDPDPSTNEIYWDKDPRDSLAYSYDDSSSITIPFPENMLLNVKAIPNALYPFPSGATLIRGSVRNTAGDPISEADVKVVGGTLNTKTRENGDYVIFFPASQDDDTIQISITPLGDPPKIVNTEVRKGRTTSLSIEYP